MRKDKKLRQSSALVFLGMGFELVGLMLGALYLGAKIDQHFKLPGYGLAGLTLLAFAGWFVRIIYLLKRFEEASHEDDK